MLIRYEYLPRITSLIDSTFLIPMIQSVQIHTKRKMVTDDQSPIKRRSPKQRKTVDIHTTTDIPQVEYYFENGEISLGKWALYL